MARKKKRSEAQIAATKKLVAFNKKKRSTKTKVKSKRKRATKRKNNPIKQFSSLSYIGKINTQGKVSAFFDGSQFVTDRKKAASYTNPVIARKIAQLIADKLKFKTGVLTEKKF